MGSKWQKNGAALLLLGFFFFLIFFFFNFHLFFLNTKPLLALIILSRGTVPSLNIIFQDFNDSFWPLSQPDCPKITNIQVQCKTTSIQVRMDFDQPFHGMVFSKGHFSDQNCVHLPAKSGATSIG